MKSMTGYGYAKGDVEGLKIACEVFTLNHRFQETTLNIPGSLVNFRPRISRILKKYFSRGAITLTIELLQGRGSLFDVDVSSLLSYRDRIQSIMDKYQIDGKIGIETLLNLPEVITEKRDNKIKWDALKHIVVEAVEKADGMRKIEGEHILKDLHKKIKLMQRMLLSIKKSIGKEERDNTERVAKKSALFEKMGYALSQDEIMILNGNGGIDEEIVRMESHLNQFKKVMKSSLCGKRLNFLIQEMGRELNTITSKLSSSKNIYKAIEMKNLAEKLKEQVQNIE